MQRLNTASYAQKQKNYAIGLVTTKVIDNDNDQPVNRDIELGCFCCIRLSHQILTTDFIDARLFHFNWLNNYRLPARSSNYCWSIIRFSLAIGVTVWFALSQRAHVIRLCRVTTSLKELAHDKEGA